MKELIRQSYLDAMGIQRWSLKSAVDGEFVEPEIIEEPQPEKELQPDQKPQPDKELQPDKESYPDQVPPQDLSREKLPQVHSDNCLSELKQTINQCKQMIA